MNSFSNPLSSYQIAIQHYKDKKFPQALDELFLALDGFEKRVGSHSIECFKCYSTLISCYRDQQKYSDAISYAEKVINEFSGKASFELDTVMKKYHECLKLQDCKPEMMYEKAVFDYKSKHYYCAIQKLLFAIDNFDKSKKLELASCHSKLGSCYQ